MPTTTALDSEHQETHSQVLIVDRSDESRSVLRMLLERKGLKILEARAAKAGLAIARLHQPHVIVLDVEASPIGDEQVRAGYLDEAMNNQAQLLVLGTARTESEGLPTRQFVAKPYHYAPLIRKIEELIADLPLLRKTG